MAPRRMGEWDYAKKKKAKCGLYMLEYKKFSKYSTVLRKENLNLSTLATLP